MAKKQYTGAKVTVVAVSAAALVYGTAWFSLAPKQQAEASTPADSQPVTTSSTLPSAASQSTTSTTRVPQAPVPRAKRSRAS